MGYYDDFDYKSKKNKKSNSFFTSFLSAVLGGLLVVMLLPPLARAGVVDLTPSNLSPTNQQNQIDQGATKQINVDVNSEIVQAAEKVKPAVVNVVNIQEQTNIFTRQTKKQDVGIGSGIVFDKKNGKAYIVTNNHVIQGATDVEVALADGKRVKAEILGSDALTDLAVISIDEKYAKAVAHLGDSTNLKPGEPAIAIGNPLGLEFSQTVTVGVISSNNRTIKNSLNMDTEVIQTDAAINLGNSGGPLVNINGDVIGINSAKIAASGVEGLGFAIPISNAKPVIDELIKYHRVKRPYMGIEPLDLSQVSLRDRTLVLKLPTSVNDGVVILSVGGPAELAGLKRADVIVKLDDNPIKTSADLRNYLYKNKKIGDKMKVTYYRDGKLLNTTLTLSEQTKQ